MNRVSLAETNCVVCDDIAQLNGVPGSAIAARNIIRMVERHMTHPYTHAEIRKIFSVNRGITTEDLLLGAG